jgi:hypothetical protein
MENLISSLIQAKKEFGSVKKDSRNPYFKSNYASLDAVLKAVEPALLKNDLILTQKVEFDENFERSYVISLLFHSSGESIDSGKFYLPAGVETKPQEKGAAISYARRYSVQALLGLSAEDDDGNSVSSGNNNASLPFKGQQQAIEWASQQLGSEEKAQKLMEEAQPDEKGRKAPDFYRRVQAKVNQVQNEY